METHEHLENFSEPPQEGLNVVFLAARFLLGDMVTWPRCGLQGRRR